MSSANVNGGIILVEKLVKEDMDLGVNLANRSMPGEGTQTGHQINLSSFGLYDVALWTPAAPLAGEEEITALTIPGAQVGDAVIVTFSSPTFAAHRDLSIEGKVSNPNEVLIILRNHSQTEQINPGTGTLRVVVLPLPASE